MGKRVREWYVFLPVVFAGGILSYLYRLKLLCVLTVSYTHLTLPTIVGV